MKRSLPLAISLLSLVGTSLAWGASPSRITKGPYLQELGPTSVVVRVEVDPPAPIEIEVRPSQPPDGGGGSIALHDGTAILHSVRVDALRPAGSYTYRVIAAGATSPQGTFTTAPAPDANAPFSFTLYGDDRSDNEVHAATVHAMTSVPADFLVHTGDFVESGYAGAEWQSFFDIESAFLRDRCVYACVGNHELVDPTGALFERYFGPEAPPGAKAPDPSRLYRSFRWSNARFFLLNGMDTWSGAEKDWFRDELTKADSEPALVWRFVVVHHGPWSSGRHGNNVRMLEGAILPLLAQHKVDLILSGHDHDYERGDHDHLKYVVSGGAGAPLYRETTPSPSTRKFESTHHFVEFSVTPDGVKLTSVRVDGSVIERCGFTKVQGDWDCDSASAAPPSVVASSNVAVSAKHEELVVGHDEPKASSSSRCACSTIGATERVSVDCAVLVLGALTLARRRSKRG